MILFDQMSAAFPCQTFTKAYRIKLMLNTDICIPSMVSYTEAKTFAKCSLTANFVKNMILFVKDLSHISSTGNQSMVLINNGNFIQDWQHSASQQPNIETDSKLKSATTGRGFIPTQSASLVSQLNSKFCMDKLFR